MLTPGDIVTALVTRVETFGVFLEYGSERILVEIPETSWIPRARDCRDFTEVGQKLQVKLLKFAASQSLWSGSVKQVHPEENPWRDPSVFSTDRPWRGTVTHVIRELRVEHIPITRYFVEIQPGVTGMLRAEKVSGELSKGDQVEVDVESVDAERQRIEFSLRRRLSGE